MRARYRQLQPALTERARRLFVASEALAIGYGRTARSPRHLVAALAQQGHQTSMKMVARLLKELGYSLQANRKRLEGAQHPVRHAQFEHINETVRRQIAAGAPVGSVNTTWECRRRRSWSWWVSSRGLSGRRGGSHPFTSLRRVGEHEPAGTMTTAGDNQRLVQPGLLGQVNGKTIES